jgi:hypothetical protein
MVMIDLHELGSIYSSIVLFSNKSYHRRRSIFQWFQVCHLCNCQLDNQNFDCHILFALCHIHLDHNSCKGRFSAWSCHPFLNLVQLICHILHLAIMIISEYHFLVVHLQLSVTHYPMYSILGVVRLKVLPDSIKLLAQYNLSQLS